MNEQQQQEMPQRIMSEIHRLVQKLKEGGMNVDSSVDTETSVVDGTVKYTDKLTITGKFEKVRFDERSPEEVKTALLEQRQAIEAQHQEVIAKVDDVIAVVEKKKQ